jgi:hypothetical protein
VSVEPRTRWSMLIVSRRGTKISHDGDGCTQPPPADSCLRMRQSAVPSLLYSLVVPWHVFPLVRSVKVAAPFQFLWHSFMPCLWSYCRVAKSTQGGFHVGHAERGSSMAGLSSRFVVVSPDSWRRSRSLHVGSLKFRQRSQAH